MRVGVSNWLGMEFVELSAEAEPGTSARSETDSLFAAFADVLGNHGLTLADSLRSRLFGRDRAARDDASEVRRETLAGPARAATSRAALSRPYSRIQFRGNHRWGSRGTAPWKHRFAAPHGGRFK